MTYTEEKDSKNYLAGLRAMQEAIAPGQAVDNPTDIIVFDTETTGLDSNADQILQISVIDGTGNILMNEYVKPVGIKEWPGIMAS